ncbi:MAG: hypothetical protein K2K64_00345 [Muribaculaceae bacterium]|nr:hypothetical protein [Muribaculaceae bacterium]
MLLVSLNSCSGCTETEHTEAVTADITAAQMMGRNDARFFVNRQWNDSSELRYRLALIRHQSDSLKKSRGMDFAAVYDSTFISTIRAVNPELASSVTRLNSNPK